MTRRLSAVRLNLCWTSSEQPAAGDRNLPGTVDSPAVVARLVATPSRLRQLDTGVGGHSSAIAAIKRFVKGFVAVHDLGRLPGHAVPDNRHYGSLEQPGSKGCSPDSGDTGGDFYRKPIELQPPW